MRADPQNQAAPLSYLAETKSYRFGRFVVDRRSACLRCDGVVLPLRPKSFDVLVYLVQNPGRLVPKGELIDNVWQDVMVTDNSLVQCIKDIRQALNDNAHAEIETVAKRGYLFASPVVVIDGNAVDLGSPTLTAAAAGGDGALPLPDRPSIAVLPFANMSGDSDQEYFADGISEDLITGLSRIRWLFVIARNSTFVYKHRAVDVKQVSRELGVRYVLEGSVRRAGSRIRITAQLVDAITGGHHWAERYDRELGDIFAVQDEITSSVVAAIEPRLLAAEGIRSLSRSAEDRGAWELVARAQTHVWRLTRLDYETAIDALKRTVETHPDYAPARSLLAFCLSFAAHMGWVNRDHGLLVGRQHAVRAVALDDCDSWGQIALGYLALMEKRTEESIAAFRRAVLLNPSSAAAHGKSWPRPGICRARPRGDRACRGSDQAQSPGSGDGAVPRGCRGSSLLCRSIRGSCRILVAALASTPRFSGGAAIALRGPRADRTDRGGPEISRNRTARATPAIDRLDQSQRSLSDA